MNLIIFDIDGTLLRTHGAGSRSTNHVFRQLFGVEDAWGSTSAFGKTDPNIFDEIANRTLRRPLSDAEMAQVCAGYLEQFAEELSRSDRFTVLPGVTALLKALSEHEGMWLGLQTGNLEAAGWLKLKTAGIETMFRFGGFAEDARDRTTIVRSAIRRGVSQVERMGHRCGAVIVIGDTPSDVTAGRENGARTIAVATGGYTRAELEHTEPDIVVDSFAELEPAVEAFISLLHGGQLP